MDPGECFTVQFAAGFNGRIEGPAEQCVKPDESSEPVFARPRSGFTFVGWSDGSLENPRVIVAPDADRLLSAAFRTSGLTTVWIG